MNAPPKAIAGVSTFVDDRIGAGNFLKRNLRKIFPDHWSFLLGEIALYSFIILLLTGTFLTFWFKPGMGEVTYTGLSNVPTRTSRTPLPAVVTGAPAEPAVEPSSAPFRTVE